MVVKVAEEEGSGSVKTDAAAVDSVEAMAPAREVAVREAVRVVVAKAMVKMAVATPGTARWEAGG